MGFDVTFHPVSQEDLQKYLFDVIDNPSVAEERAASIVSDPQVQSHILEIYKKLPEMMDEEGFGGVLGFLSATIAGVIHPYWYARGSALSFLSPQFVPAVAGLFTPIPEIAKGRASEFEDYTDGLIAENWSGSGFIKPELVPTVENLLQTLDDLPPVTRELVLESAFDHDGLEAIRCALAFARENGIGMVEASDVVIPIANACTSDSENMRAQFIDRMDP